jgi:hypothetical protein
MKKQIFAEARISKYFLLLLLICIGCGSIQIEDMTVVYPEYKEVNIFNRTISLPNSAKIIDNGVTYESTYDGIYMLFKEGAMAQSKLIELRTHSMTDLDTTVLDKYISRSRHVTADSVVYQVIENQLFPDTVFEHSYLPYFSIRCAYRLKNVHTTVELICDSITRGYYNAAIHKRYNE